MKLTLNHSQKAFCYSDAENITLLAPAGSGKTLSIVERCKYLLEKNEQDKILIFTFSRVARDEILQRINQSVKDPIMAQRIKVETLNQYGNSYLRRNFSGLSLKESKRDRFFDGKNLLRPVWIKYPVLKKVLSKPSKSNLFTEIMEIIDSLKSIGFSHNFRTVNDLMEHFEEHTKWLEKSGLSRYFEAAIFEPLQKNELLDTKGIPIKPFFKFWSEATQQLWDSGVISLVDQKYWTLQTLRKKYEDKVYPKSNQYRHILIDEFQDINPLDLFLIKELARVNEASLAIVGDDDQAIYEWRGSTPSFILNPIGHFGRIFKLYKLDTNYRSPKNIVELSSNLISHNQRRVEKHVKALNTKDAQLEHLIFPSQYEYLQYLANLCKEAVEANKSKDLAIIARKKSQLIPIQIMLTSMDIPFYAKEDLNILLSSAFNDLKSVLEIIATKKNRKSSKEVVKDFMKLCNLVMRYQIKRSESKELIAYLNICHPRTLVECLDHFLSYGGELKSDDSGEMVIKFHSAISAVVESETVSEAIENVGIHLSGLKKHYAKSEDDIFYKDPPFTFLIDYASEYEDDFWEFIEHVERATSEYSSFQDGDDIDPEYNSSVHLMTALRAKGKEFNTVVVLDVNDGIWPNKLSETPAELEQERRVFYVAITRVKKHLILISTRIMINKFATVSPYIEEMGLG